jgi:HlyD family secretion protein
MKMIDFLKHLKKYYRFKSIVILFLLILTACGGSSNVATPTAVPTPIVSEKPTYTVQKGTVTKFVQLTGRVVPSSQQDLSFHADGYVKEVFFKQGDAVKSGDLIARLDGVEKYAADIADAQLTLDQANYDLEGLKQTAPVKAAQARLGVIQAKTTLDQAQAKRDRLKYTRVSDPLILKRLQQAYDNATGTLADAKQAYALNPKDGTMLDALILAQDAYDKAQINLNWSLGKPTQAEIDQADAELAVAKANDDTAQAAWARWKDGMDASELHLAESKVADAQARLALVQQAQQTIELRAPFAGQVLSIGIAPGSQVAAFQNVLTLADPSALKITAIPAPEDLAQLGVGQAANVQLTTHSGKNYPAKVSLLPFTSANNTGATDQTQSVTLTLDDPAQALTLGEVATATIQVDQREGVLWMPPAALRTFQGQDSVLAQINGIQRRVDVRLGLKSVDRVEILEGLTEGQVVVGP